MSASVPPWLKEKFSDAVHWLQQKGYIRQDRSQRSDEFMEPTAEGKQVEIDPATMTFVMPRKWTHCCRSATRDTAGGTAFVVGPRLLATCAHAALGFPTVPQRLPTLNVLAGAVESLPTDYKGKKQFIQVSLASSGGLSGGPVINKCGRAVGVVSERTFEAVADAAVPAKAFPQVVPISYLKDITGRSWESDGRRAWAVR